MMRLFLLMIFTTFCQASFAQDSSQVAYTQESSTLVKQRFIDRYENIFMTKVPTRQMFKVSISGSQLRGTGLNASYEYKLLPSLSIEAGIYAQTSSENGGILTDFTTFSWNEINLWTAAKLRWYYNMSKRMQQGLSANNFSGAYFGFAYDQSILRAKQLGYSTNAGRIGLLYGFQSRFFSKGHVDFSIGLFQKEVGQSYFEVPGFFDKNNFVLATQVNLGIAFGDWKKAASNPKCDFLICDEHIQSQLKIELPDFVIRLQKQRIKAGIAYEQKLGNSPFSVQAALEGGYNYDRLFRTSYAIGAGLQFRHYFLQKMQVRKGKAGNNFTGPYWAVEGNFTRSMFTNLRWEGTNYEQYKDYDNGTNGSVALGYQLRLFKKIYFDASVFWRRYFEAGFDLPAYNILSSKMTLGFTF